MTCPHNLEINIVYWHSAISQHMINKVSVYNITKIFFSTIFLKFVLIIFGRKREFCKSVSL